MSLEAWKKKRTTVKAKLTRFKNQFAAYDKNSGLGTWIIQLEKIEPLFAQFDEVQTEIDMLRDDNQEMEVQDRDEFEFAYFELILQIREFINNHRQRESVTATISRTGTPTPEPSIQTSSLNELANLLSANRLTSNLPTIKIPKFDGSQKDWVKFRDSFNTMVHERSNLTNIQKFHYLDEALTGEAARTIQSLGVSDANYETAWKSLVERFEDSRALIHFHMSALFDLQVLSKADHVALRQLIDDTHNNLLALKSLGEKTDEWDTVMVHLLTTKLDSFTRREWEKHLLSLPQKITIKEMLRFFENHCKYLQRVSLDKQDKGKGLNSKNVKPKFTERVTSHATTKRACVLCQESHTLYHCPEFRALPVENKIKEASRLQVCFNCLTPGHHNRQCHSRPCNKCSRKHNSLLHRDYSKNEPSKECEQDKDPSNSLTGIVPSEGESTKAVHVTNLVHSHVSENVMLGTAIVLVKDSQGEFHECRALLDSCSQVHLMTQQFCKKLKIPVSKSNTVVSGVFKTTQEPQHYTSVEVSSRTSEYCKEIVCLITSEITDDMPNMRVRRSDFEIPKNITLADPFFDKTRPVDMLIGAGIFWKLMCVGQIHLHHGQPILQKTTLGWIVTGPINTTVGNKRVCNLITNQQLHKDVQRFWEIENHRPINHFPVLNLKDDLEQHFTTTTERDKDGKFIVTIPLKNDGSELGESLNMAQKRFYSMERKLSKDPSLRDKYLEFMEDYETKGHMSRIPENDIVTSKTVNYLPHHAVKKEGSTTTKVRVVFDGSAKTTSGLSFNSIQKVGPVVQSDLFSIVLRFRQYPIVLTADIAQMYRQIKVNESQQDLQRILWRKDSSHPIQHYRLKTVTYGTAAAPYLATRTLRQIGEDNKKDFPSASEAIIGSFYVDDFIAGSKTISEAQQLKKEVTTILAAAGFELRKWASNRSEALNELTLSPSARVIQADKDPKTLGLLWKPETDRLSYIIKELTHQRITKRIILSLIAAIFDPLGLVGPAIIRAKIILQQVWKLQLDWDEALPQELHTLWIEFSRQLKALNDISVPRFALQVEYNKIQLHGFCDASEAAYGACIYIRSSAGHDNNYVQLLCAKSRVAPLKQISLPRLELQAALLLSQLTETVTTALDLKFDDMFFWSDSTITLCWIKSAPSRWKTYIANRTSEIQELSNNNWNHVRSEENPADLISRGINPEELETNDLWWAGPSWLSQPRRMWPVCMSSEIPEKMPEEKECKTTCITTENKCNLLERFSTLTQLVRVTAYCLRFINNSRNSKDSREKGNLTAMDCERSLTCLLKIAQSQSFSDELKNIKNSKQISSKSNLVSLNPFVDELGLLRVGGRLINAPIPFDQRHPVILSPHNPLTRLIIVHEHEKLMHSGCQLTISSLRQRFWPLACKNAVKNVIRKCMKCFRAKPTAERYIMGNLPSARVIPARPFFSCGVDYAGPFYVIEKPRSKIPIKVYVCIFVCLTTKAVHIELARDLSTNAFFNCLHRFIARRGKCRHIYSDNGKNFVGAKNELHELYQRLSNSEFQESVSAALANDNIVWHMIPPHAPNFGGLWEAAVKSMKKHLLKVVGLTRLMYEELYTILTQVEACLNSRPLSPISNDPKDLNPLTPGHFLIGDSLAAVPQADLRDICQNRLDRYQHLQYMFQHFWQRWQSEYLTQLQQRRKWAQPVSSQIRPDSMVIIHDDNLPPLKWRLGRVTEVHPGRDGVIPVVSIRVAESIIKRPISKVCLLPIDEKSSDTTK